MKKDFIRIILIVVFYTILTLLLWRGLQGYLTNDSFSNLLSRLGIFAPIGMFVIQVLQVLIAPIPVQPVSMASGYIFGALWGFIISYSGLLIGSLIAFYLGKRFGRPFIKRVINKKAMDKYDGYAQKMSASVLFLIFLLPFFPDDEIIYILGMSKTRLKKLLIPLLIGKTGGAFTAIMGAGFKEWPQYTFHIIFLVLLLTVLTFRYKEKIERVFDRFIHKN